MDRKFMPCVLQSAHLMGKRHHQVAPQLSTSVPLPAPDRPTVRHADGGELPNPHPWP